MTYIFEFDIVPSKQEAFWNFMEETGTPFWTQFEFVEKYEIFSRLGGAPAYEGHVELGSFQEFEQIRNHANMPQKQFCHLSLR